MADEGEGITPSDGCGCSYDELGYSWSQGEGDVEIRIPIPQGTRAKMLDVRISGTSVAAGMKGKPPLVEGKLYGTGCKEDDSTWNIEDGSTLVIHLEKQNRKHEEWWDCAIQGHPKLNMKQLKPPAKSYQALDGEAQGVIRKMMFDQQQKRQGLPTSEEMQMQEMMAKFGAPPGLGGGGPPPS
eukprot:TRINITY_DN48063_c0_g1_i1.p2 TRINITY_DN48063_c0_g1~~TRINITY_DN48063_c0_g1_i1.p2  ORF type:complete len:201 (+),score=54.94 TRINITY_DN48063_c0_g1_i1:57-605(+)